MKFARFLFGIFAIVFLLSCSGKDKPTEPDIHTSTFPLEVGNHWRYSETVIKIPYNIPSLADTVTYNGAISIIGLDTLPNSVIAYIIDDTTYNPPGINLEWDVLRNWYAIDDSMLKDYAVQSVYPIGATDIQYRDTAIVLLDFPLNEGKYWVAKFGQVNDERTVVGHERLSILNRIYECDIVNCVNRQYTLTESLDVKFWYSNEGMIKYVQQQWPFYARDSSNVIVDSTKAVLIKELTAIDLVQ